MIDSAIRRAASRSVATALGLWCLALSVAGTAGADVRHFDSSQAAVQALVAALTADDEAAVEELLGAEGAVGSGDPVADHNVRQRFIEMYEEKHELTSTSATSATLEIGPQDWPFPIPIRKGDEGWYFDTEAGEDELVNRRVGRNELSAIQACLAYFDAQREYYERGVEGQPLRYAQKFSSAPGEHDGLYWPTDDDEIPSPLGELFAAARAEGYAADGGGDPFHGYYFKIMTAQGPNAPGGAYDYVAHDLMIGGFALVAYPAGYGQSGVMTFIVNQDGVVYQKDLGLETAETAIAMKEFDPDDSWTRVDDPDQGAE